MEGHHNGVSSQSTNDRGFQSFFISQERLFFTVKIVLVGKYTDLKDSYMSVIKALEHSAFRVHRKLILQVHFLFMSRQVMRLILLPSGLNLPTSNRKPRNQILPDTTMLGG